MIVDLPETTSAAISKKLVDLRNDVGTMAMGRVLTLVVMVPPAEADDAIATAMRATRQHPSRIVVLVDGDKQAKQRLDADIRIGGDAGASEIVVLRPQGQLAGHPEALLTPLLLADAPIVVWWPADCPPDVATSPLGAMAQRRVTDAAASDKPFLELDRRREHYADGDTDLAWARVTRWRALLAAALDQPPFEPVVSAVVVGAKDSPSADLLAGWLTKNLRCPVQIARSEVGTGLVSVRLERETGVIDLVRPTGDVATLEQHGQPTRRVALAHREKAECLSDELARLDPDETYRDALRDGIPALEKVALTHAQAVRQGLAPSTEDAQRAANRLAAEQRAMSSAAVVEREPDHNPTDESVRQATRDRLK